MFLMGNKQQHISKPDLEVLQKTEHADARFLILHNDEVHTFDYVINALVRVCEMDEIQAEQCTFLVHYKGKCDVKKGDFDYLKPYKEALLEKGLEATID
jgi:ATP-dependent Clp protease adaptor protein ClpS